MCSYLPIRDERLRQIRRATEGNESLRLFRCVILTGWPDSKDHIPAQVIPYFHFRDELSVQDGSTFKGERVVIPQSIRRDMLKRIHSSYCCHQYCNTIATHLPSCFFIQFLEQLLKFPLNFTLLK